MDTNIGMTTKVNRKDRGFGRNPGLPTDLRSFLGPKALLKLCLDAIQHVSPALLEEARQHASQGSRPEMFLTLLTYCYASGICDSREVEAASRTDRTIRYICAGERPDWASIRRFRRRHRELLRDSLLHVFKQTWAFHFETGDADYVGCDWFESQLVRELIDSAVTRLDLAALLDRTDAD